MEPVKFYELAEEQAFQMGLPWFTKPYSLNLWGVRNETEGTNLFDDLIFCAYRDGAGRPQFERWKATTDPGRKSLDHPEHPLGTFTLAPGRFAGLWTRGLHRQRYPALVQCPDVAVEGWRGLDRQIRFRDARGINLHHASRASRVDWYSAGCQVVQDPVHLERILELYALQLRYCGLLAARVSYTLVDVRERPAFAALLCA